MNDDQLLRYSRHILVDELGIEAQQRFLDAHAIVVGVGGLGSPAAMYLAAAGVGQLTLVDADTVDLTNLQRQILHVTASVGQRKVESGRETIARLNPEVKVNAITERVDDAWLDRTVPSATVVLDCTDNFATRHAINRACVAHRVPLVSGAALRFDGQISTFDFRDDASPCYACVFPEDQPFEEVACSTMGVFAPTVGIIGAMQAAEALRVIAGVGTPLVGRLMMLDSLHMEWTTMRIARQPDCAVCAERQSASGRHA
ncbi:HesA/MoeB/ThiF family protein [Paraburkholderia solisilvae]|uniref:Molybdopterin-synthase adenylyltransferase n=1 Tax=Paraburkholderia solisilvae TaxID=624376 RepID=A0A6J5DGC9_9BURK|nr:molybdopterin-synthase adenylyltransferase MoeB [Paraburkholderia solisilvae]CAB3753208.1 Molybdopterin-synthase adenylyltransferase [Paraburkholderia solisilvae]